MPTTATAITSRTAAGTHNFTLDSGASAQIYCTPNLGMRERVTLNRSIDSGSNHDVKVDTGKGGNVLLSEGTSSVLVTGPGYFQIVKPVTAVATAIYIDV